jgi:RHS repeat-associated protein
VGSLAISAVFALFLLVPSLASATELPATIKENTTLTPASNPYTGTSTIESGVTVKVEPGVKFTIGSLTVKGTLLAEGTAEEPIVFTGKNKEKPGEWNRVRFEPGSGASVLNHTEFSYGGGASSQAMAYVYGASPTIENSTFSHSILDGIWVNGGGGPEIANNHFIKNEGAAIHFKDAAGEPGKVNIHGNVVEGGTDGIKVTATNSSTTTTTMGANTVTGTTGEAFTFEGASIPGDITGNTLSGNKENIIKVSGTVAHSETWKNGGSKVLFTGEVTVASSMTLTIEPGVYLMNPAMTVKGTLLAEGTAKEPIVFTGEKEKKPGEWSHVKLEPGGGASVFNYTEFSYGAGASGQAMLFAKGSSPTIENSTFSHSVMDGIYVNAGGGPEIANNKFSGNEGRAIYFTDGISEPGKVNIHGNVVEGGANGIEAFANNASTTTTTMGANTVTGTTGEAFIFEGASIPGDITGNTLSGNKENVIKVKGTVAHSETWKNGGTKVLFTNEVAVASAATLTIEPGVYLMNPMMTVNGTLLAEGTAKEPIVFTGKKQEKPGEWSHVKLEPGGGASVFNYTEFSFGAGASGQAMIFAKGSSPTIENSTFSHSINDAIYVNAGGGPEIANNGFSENEGRAIYLTDASSEGGKVNIHGNVVAGGIKGIEVIANNASTTTTTMGSNVIIGTTGETPFSFEGASIPGDITGNTLSGNKENVIKVKGTVAHSETWKNGGTKVLFNNEVTVASAATLTIEPGVFLMNPAMTVKGSLLAEGTAEEPIVFTGKKEEKPGEWSKVKFESGSGASVLNYTEFGYGAGSSAGTMIEVKKVSPKIKHSTIRKSASYGIKVTESGSPVIEGDRFRSNANGLSYTGTGNLSAPNNDWGCSSGPKPAGCGDSVTSNVNWKPDVPLEELGGHCRGKETQCQQGADPVSLATGALDYSHRDLLLTNKSKVPLEFNRAYNSGSSADSGMGPGWSQTGLASASELESGEVLVVRQDGRQDVFQKTESGYKAPSGVTDTLAKVEGTFKLTTLQNTVYAFDSSGRIASITDDHGLKTTYAYNAEGRLATITDPSAQTLTFSYNEGNHITLVKDSTGREVKFAYSAAGDLESVTDALGGVTKYAYDASHRLTSITDPRGNVILKNTYDSQGRIIEQKDGLEDLWKLKYSAGETVVTEPQGGKITYGFDGQNRVVSETDQLGNKTITGYDAAGNVDEVLEPGGAKWTLGHDAVGRLTSVKDPEGGERKYEYDGQNRLTVSTDARGNTWAYEWSKANDLTKITDPEKGETTFTYNESGQPLTVTDPAKHKTEFSYDSRGNQLSVTDPLSHKTSFEYNSRNYLTAKTLTGLKAESYERDALGDMLARTTPEGNKTKYTYDANGLPTQITDPAEDVWKIAYNAMERPTTYTDPAEQQTKVSYNGDLKPTKVVNLRGKETTYGYDAANQLTEVASPEGEDWTFGYDSRGNRSSVIDPREFETTYEYDALNRMTEAKEPLGTTTKYGYDANGDLTSLTDPRGNTSSYAFDKLGRLTEVAQPLKRTTTYGYDAAGNQTSKTTAAGTLEYGYDAASRLTSIASGKSTLRSYGYDAANRRISATDSEGHKIEIGYNNDGSITSLNDGRGQSLARSYNSRGLLTKEEDGRGTLKYEYDKLGRMTSLTDPQGKALAFAFDPEGDLTEVKRPSGITTTNVYNEAGRLAETTSQAEGGSILEALKYGYDAAGNVLSRTDSRLEEETTYSYDGLNRLTEFNPPGEGSTAYGYDEAGNRTKAGATTYEYNALNQLTKASDGTTYSYDGAGRMTSKETEAGKTTYEWDLFDHLAKAEGPSETASYAYDGLERLSERKAGGNTQVVHYGDLTDLPIYDANGEGKATTSYVQGADGLVEQRSGEATSYPLADAHGAITAITGPTGSVESRQTYDPWGTQLSGPALEMGYLGAWERRADPTTGLIQMGARSYSPSLGGFMTEDPVMGHMGVSASVDRYPYVRDNPLNGYDLNGRDYCIDTPLGEACAGAAAKGAGKIIRDQIEAPFRNPVENAERIGSTAGEAWNAIAPARSWLGDRAHDFVKQIDFSTNEFIVDSISIVVGYGICVTATAAATAVGTPAAGAGVAVICFASDAATVGGTTMDIFDKDNSLWPDTVFKQ